MGWSIGYDSNWKRDIGYGVPATCDHPGCTEEIDRGLSYVCGGEPYGGDHGCGLYFCAAHLWITPRRPQRCSRCRRRAGKPFEAKPDHPRWIRHKLRHPSWSQWREENLEKVEVMKARLRAPEASPPKGPTSVTPALPKAPRAHGEKEGGGT